MFYYLLMISNRKEGPNLLMITSGLPYVLMIWVNRKGVMPRKMHFMGKSLNRGD
jgi:hypothetical protein